MTCSTGHSESSLLTRGSFWLKRHWAIFCASPNPPLLIIPWSGWVLTAGCHSSSSGISSGLSSGKAGQPDISSLAPALGPVYTHIWDITNLPELCLWFILSGSEGKESTCDAGDPGSIPGSGRFPGERHGYPLQDSCLENSMDRGAWRVTVHGVLESRTRLSALTLSLLIYT